MTTRSIHRPVLLSVYLPGMLLGTASQAILVLLPLYVIEVGGSLAAASAAIGLRGLGMMAGDIPAGVLAARYGDKRVMLMAIVLLSAALIGYTLTDDITLICLIAFFHGAGGSAFLLGRMSYITATCMPGIRGRIIAMLAGGMRVSALVGPLIGAAVAELAGFNAAFLLAAAASLLSVVLVAACARHEIPVVRELRVRTIVKLCTDYAGVFSTAGIAAVAFMLMRSARTTLIPLSGSAIGLDVGEIGFIVSLGAAVDVALFYPAGLAMDRFGRRATAVPSSALMAVSIGIMALATDFYSLLAIAIFAGAANGLSTGIVMTLGTDLAPADRRSEFLGLWRLLTDFGTAAGPMTIGLVVAAAPLAAASLTIAALGAAGSAVIYWCVEETLKKDA